MKMAFTVYSHKFHMHCAQAVYNIVHLFLVFGSHCTHIVIALAVSCEDHKSQIMPADR